MPDLDAAGFADSPKLVAFAPDNFLLTVQGQRTAVSFLRDADG